MNKSKFFAATLPLAVALLSMQSATAKTWRINPNENANAPFTSISAAMASDEVQPGDQLLLDPGKYSEQATITKDNITITGPGYELLQNKDWDEARSAKVYRITIKADGATIQGIQIDYMIDYKSKQGGEPVNGGLIERCCLKQLVGHNSSNITVRGNIFNPPLGAGFSGMAMEGCHSYMITNNIFNNGVVSGYENCVIENNIFLDVKTYSTFSLSFLPAIGMFSDSVIRNNIIIDANEMHHGESLIEFDPAKNNVITNNVLSAPLEKADEHFLNNEWVDATKESVFVDNPGFDGYYLREGSPAKGKAADGGDCGIFGGGTPYVQSGIPYRMPHITSAVIPSSPTDGQLVVKLKVAVQND